MMFNSYYERVAAHQQTLGKKGMINMIMNRIALAVFAAGLGVITGCGNSESSRYTANESAQPYANSATPTSEAETTTPDAILVERTAVVVVDTNKSSGTSSQIAANQDTNSATSASTGAPAETSIGAASGNTSAQADTNNPPIQTNPGSGAAPTSEQGQNSSAQSSQSEKYLDYQVFDATGKSVGTVEALWDNESGKPAFLAVKSPSRDELCVIPTTEVQESQKRNALRVPYTAETLRDAPTFAKESDLDKEAQQKVMAFFDKHEPAWNANSPSSDQSDAQPRGNQQANASTATQTEIANAERLNEATIRLKEEQLKIGKRQVNAGGVLLRKVVRTETVNRPVQLRHEELVIERVPGSGKPADANAEFAEREVFIPLLREEPVVQKDVVLKEVINVGKTATQEQQTVNANLREEDLEVVRRGDARESSGSPASSVSGSQSDTQNRVPEDQNQKASGQQNASSDSANTR